MKLHVHSGPLPVLPPYFELGGYTTPEKSKLDLTDLLNRLIEEGTVRRVRARADSIAPYKAQSDPR